MFGENKDLKKFFDLGDETEINKEVHENRIEEVKNRAIEIEELDRVFSKREGWIENTNQQLDTLRKKAAQLDDDVEEFIDHDTIKDQRDSIKIVDRLITDLREQVAVYENMVSLFATNDILLRHMTDRLRSKIQVHKVVQDAAKFEEMVDSRVDRLDERFKQREQFFEKSLKEVVTEFKHGIADFNDVVTSLQVEAGDETGRPPKTEQIRFLLENTELSDEEIVGVVGCSPSLMSKVK